VSWDGTGVSVGTNTPFATFLAQVRREIEESTATVWSDASLLAWANDGMADIARRTRILSDWQSGSTVVGQASYALADGTFQVDKFFCGTGEIARVTGDDYYASFSLSPATGAPRDYAIIGAYAYLYPTPSTVATYRYHRYYTPVAFTSATTTTTLPFVPSFDHSKKTPQAPAVPARRPIVVICVALSNWQPMAPSTAVCVQAVSKSSSKAFATVPPALEVLVPEGRSSVR